MRFIPTIRRVIRKSHLEKLAVSLLLISTVALTQTIRVDSTPGHGAKSFVPTTALGAGIDRISTAATNKLFTEPVMNKVLSAGWQTVSYQATVTQ